MNLSFIASPPGHHGPLRLFSLFFLMVVVVVILPLDIDASKASLSSVAAQRRATSSLASSTQGLSRNRESSGTNHQDYRMNAIHKRNGVSKMITSRNTVVDVEIRGGAGTSSPPTATTAVAGAVVLALLERLVRQVFSTCQITFPSQLGGCIILLTFMLLAQAIVPGWGDCIYDQLAPGAALLAKWLPTFFIPGLAMLPLAPSIGNGLEVAKVLAVVIIGFAFTLTTVALSVLGLRTVQGTAVVTTPTTTNKKTTTATTTVSSSPKPFSDATMKILLQGVIVSGCVSLLVKWLSSSTSFTNLPSSWQTPLRTLFFGITTVAAFVWGARLPTAFTKLIHPLVTSTILTWLVTWGYAAVTQSTFLDVLRTYRLGGGSVSLLKSGAGDILLYLLGPAVVSFALSMYSRKKLLKENVVVVVLAILVSSASGLLGTAAFARLIQLGGQHAGASLIRLSVLARNVTTALAMVVTNILGGDMSLVAVVVVLTGIFGATFGRSLLDLLGIQDPVSRGLGIGTSAQGLGVASLADEPDAFPFAAMAMVLNAIAATILVSIPSVKATLVQIATGGLKK